MNNSILYLSSAQRHHLLTWKSHKPAVDILRWHTLKN